MKIRRIVWLVIIGLVLVAAASCSSSKLDEDSAKMMRTALTLTSGVEITGLEMDKKTLEISYTQTGQPTLAANLQRWLDMSAVAISFMEEPRTIVIRPSVADEPVAEVTVRSEEIASWLNGNISLEQALASIQVEELE